VELQQQGFDFCYDKKLYDRLEHGPAESVRLHLCADMDYQERLVRFIENHDEPRPLPRSLREGAGRRRYHNDAAWGVVAPRGAVRGRKIRLPYFSAAGPMSRLTLTSRHSTIVFWHHCKGEVEKRRVAPLSTKWLAGQSELPQPGGLVLGRESSSTSSS